MPILPIFPLDLVVLPGEPVPLHIFEERYKQMIADCAPLAGERHYQPFGITFSKEDKLSEIGCTVVVEEILHKYPSGELDIMTYGKQRYRLLSTRQRRQYLTGEVEWLPEDNSVSPELRDEVLKLYEEFLSLIEVEDLTLDPRSDHLSYEIAYRVNLEKGPKLLLLESSSETERLYQLQKYLLAALPEIEQAKEFRRRVRANGYFA